MPLEPILLMVSVALFVEHTPFRLSWLPESPLETLVHARILRYGDFVTGESWSLVGTLLHLNLFRTFAR